MHLGAIHRLRTYGFHPGLTQFLTNYVMRFSSSQCPRRSAAGDAAQRAVHGPKGSALPRGLEPGSLRFRDDHLHIDLTGARSPEPSLVLLRRFWFWFWVWFLLPMKIENRLLIGRDFFADWLSVAFNFLPNREIFSRGLSAAARLFDYKTTMRRGSVSSHSAHIHFHPRTR